MSDPVNVLLHGDCRELLKTLAADSVDALVTDPPAGIEFMGKAWDAFAEQEDDPQPTGAQTEEWDVHPGTPFARQATPRYRGKTNQSLVAFQDFLTGVAEECYRVMKPGAHGLVWSIPRTSHHTAMALERAGFEIRDCIYHCFGSGFPKSLNIGKVIDRMAGAEREVIGTYTARGFSEVSPSEDGRNQWAAGEVVDKEATRTAPATDDAKRWDGWGTSLKPAVEVWWLVRKPIEQQNVAAQVLKTGTGALNIDASRIKTGDNLNGGAYSEGAGERHDGTESWRFRNGGRTATLPGDTRTGAALGMFEPGTPKLRAFKPPPGRWPANLVLSHSAGCRKVGTKTVKAPVINRFEDGMKPFGEGAGHPYTSTGGGEEEQPVFECEPGCPVRAMDEQSGNSVSVGGDKSGGTAFGQGSGWNPHENRETEVVRRGDSGGASRFFQNFEPQYDVPFFYTGKASKRDKNADLDEEQLQNKHPTVKSQQLMRYLVKLVTPPGGVVLDPFAGSGSTLVAAVTEGFSYIGIEREAEYIEIAKKRVAAVSKRVEEKKFGEDIFALMESWSDDD